MRQGYVSVKAAAEFYGVIVDPQTFAADAAASARLRTSRRSNDVLARAAVGAHPKFG